MKILFLSTWFPYPPDQGCKNRAYHLLKGAANGHDVTLVSFRDCDLDPAWIRHVETLCRRVEIVDRDPFAAKPSRRRLGWFDYRPSSVSATYSREMENRVKAITQEWRPDCIMALTFVTAPYAISATRDINGVLRVADVDNLTAKMLYEEYRRPAGIPMRARRLLAWWKFYRYEQSVFGRFDLNLTVSEMDRKILVDMLKCRPQQVAVTANGVDTHHFRPGIAEPEPGTLVFSGALTYSANLQAMEFFLKDIYPDIRRGAPETRLRITGRHEGVRTEHLRLDGHASLTGYVEDIRPVVAGSWICVVPLLSGGGTRIKILEAMALGTPVVSTPKGTEGLDVKNDEHLLLADSPQHFAEQTLRLLRDPQLRARLVTNARRLVQEKYEWSGIENKLSNLLKAHGPGTLVRSDIPCPTRESA